MTMIDNPSSETSTITLNISNWLQTLLMNLGISEDYIHVTKLIVLLLLASLTVAALLFIAKPILDFVMKRAHNVTKISLLGYMVKNKIPYYIALLVPYTFIRSVIPIIFEDYPKWISPCEKATKIYLVLLVIWSIVGVVKSFFNLLQEKPAFENRPMHSYIQVISIFLYGAGIVISFAIISGQSVTVILGALGALSAVTMLVFQDSIKGFVGSVQLTTNNMVELGDWITMPKYGADGNVEEVTLNTVKVQNFDKTVTTIPTYALIADSFQNWRGMQESGGRRVKKCLYIKQGTIRFMQDDELTKFRKVECLSVTIAEKEKQYEKMNKSLIDNAVPVTNNDLFMAYAMDYLRNHEKVANTMTLLVRQLSPTPEGVPVEIYIFTATTVWAEYEAIATDIINHLIAMTPVFDLKIFENLSDTTTKLK